MTPVGPGHEKYLADAVDSVLANRHYKKVIIVWDSQENIRSLQDRLPVRQVHRDRRRQGCGSS